MQLQIVDSLQTSMWHDEYLDRPGRIASLIPIGRAWAPKTSESRPKKIATPI